MSGSQKNDSTDRVDIDGSISPSVIERNDLSFFSLLSADIMTTVTNRSALIFYPPASFKPVTPEASFTSSVNNSITSSFTDTTDYDPDIWSWDFGDGTTTSSQNPTKAYTAEGRYVVSLTASRTGGGTSIFSQSIVAVYKDGPNSWYRPRSAAGYSALNLTSPSALYLCQEATGNLAPTIDTMGAGQLTGAESGRVYQQSLSSWDQRFVGLTSPLIGSRWDSGSGSFAVASGESFALLGYLSFAASSSAKQLYGKGDGWGLDVTGSRYRATLIGSTVTSSLDHSGLTSSVHIVVIYRNATSDESGLVSDLESFTTVHDESARGGTCGIGDVEVTNTACDMRVNVFAVYKGSAAEQNWQNYINALKGQ